MSHLSLVTQLLVSSHAMCKRCLGLLLGIVVVVDSNSFNYCKSQSCSQDRQFRDRDQGQDQQ